MRGGEKGRKKEAYPKIDLLIERRMTSSSKFPIQIHVDKRVSNCSNHILPEQTLQRGFHPRKGFISSSHLIHPRARVLLAGSGIGVEIEVGHQLAVLLDPEDLKNERKGIYIGTMGGN